jgi:hypothetical protein
MYEYCNAVLRADDMNESIVKRARDGWRLHTCVPFYQSNSTFWVVMEREVPEAGKADGEA